MKTKTKFQKIKIVEFERSWQTLELLHISLVLSAFMAAMNEKGFWHWAWMIAMFVFLFFTIRKIRRVRTHGLKVVVEKTCAQAPDGAPSESPAKASVQDEEDQWFEQAYPDPDQELFPEKFEEQKEQKDSPQEDA